MSETLYRKYRPARFADVAEQQHVVRTLLNQLANGTLAHAYLFSGPRGVGKTTIARLLAKAANCIERKVGESEPCNTCSACIAFSEGRYMDTVEMDAASNTGVDNVRDNVIENVRFMPQQGKYKVFIIDEVHMLSGAAFNALLKTLEEPPAHALFILATTELHKIPATIISRCQRFDFHRIPVAEMVVRLAMIAKQEGVTVDDAVLQSISRLSEGCLRDAESLLGQIFAVGGTHITVENVASVLPSTNIALCASLVDAMSRSDLSGALTQLNVFVEGGGSVRFMTDELLEYIRALLFVTLGDVERSAYDAVTEAALCDTAKRITSQSACSLLDLVLTARSRTTLTLLPQLPLEIAFTEFCAHAPSAVSTPRPVPIAPLPVQTPAPIPTSTPSQSQPPPTSPLKGEGTLTFTLEEIQNKWSRCCDYVADRSAALPLILNNAKPSSINGNTVTLAFAYGFHADTFKEQKNLRLVEDAIAEVMMQRADVKTIVIAAKEDVAVASLAAAFGGSVV